MGSYTFQGLRRGAKPVAVFKVAPGYYHYPPEGPAVLREEDVFDERSLAIRIRNLREQGLDTAEEEKAMLALQEATSEQAPDA